MAISESTMMTALVKFLVIFPDSGHSESTIGAACATYIWVLERAGVKKEADLQAAAFRHLAKGKCFPTPAHFIEAFEELKPERYMTN